MKRLRSIIFTGISSASLCAGGMALAQTAPTAAPEKAPRPSTATARPSEAGISDIIVTAQKREQRLQDVPISVSVFSARQLETRGITSSADLAQVTPSLTLSEQSGYGQPFIRGMGSAAVISGDAGSVSTYIDGVYQPVSFGPVYSLANIQSVQVLKGPQGTLFGRNTAGGAILLTTEQPGFAWKGRLSANYGNYNDHGVNAYVNGPISDQVAVSLLGSYSKRDGHLNDIIRNKRVGGHKEGSIRGSILFQASDNLKFTLSGNYLKINSNSGGLGNPRNGFLGKTADSPDPTGFYDVAMNAISSRTARQYGGSLRADWDVGPVRVVSITAKSKNYFKLHNHDSDATPIAYQLINQDEYTDSFSQELQVVSNHGGPLNWVVGAFYYEQQAGYDRLQINSTMIVSGTKSKAFAVFADGTYDFGDVEFTAGVRYNVDKQKFSGTSNGILLADNFKEDWTSVTPRAVLSYHPNRDTLLYASYSKGFKAGTFSPTTFLDKPIDPERIDAYEVGFKLQPAPWASVNAAAYLYDSKGLVIQTQDPVTNIQILENAAAGRIKGVEIETILRPVRQLDISAGLSYLDAKYRDFPDAQAFFPNPPGIPPALPDSTGNGSVSVDAAGKRIVRSPKWTFNVGATLTVDLPSGGKLVPSASVYRSSSFYFDTVNRLKQGAYALVNAQVEWRLPGDQIGISIYGKNLTNSQYLRSFKSSRFTDVAIVGFPRTYGVRLDYRF